MKCRIRVTQIVELTVDGASEDKIRMWADTMTPEGIVMKTYDNVERNDYIGEILKVLPENYEVDYVIEDGEV